MWHYSQIFCLLLIVNKSTCRYFYKTIIINYACHNMQILPINSMFIYYTRRKLQIDIETLLFL